jgi:hypothetical protein
MPSIENRRTINIEGTLFNSNESVTLYNTLDLNFDHGYLYGYRYAGRIAQIQVVATAYAQLQWWIQLRSGRRVILAETTPFSLGEKIEGLIAAGLTVGYGSAFGVTRISNLEVGQSIEILGTCEELGWPGLVGVDTPNSWGNILGTLSEQVDLKQALDTKASVVQLEDLRDELGSNTATQQAIAAITTRIQSLESNDPGQVEAIATLQQSLADLTAGNVADYEATFVNASLSVNGSLAVVHGLNSKPSSVAVYPPNGEAVNPDNIVYVSPNAIAIELTSFTPISGVWTVSVIV